MLKNWFPRWTIYHAYARALFSRFRLPPGALTPLDRLEKSDRRYLLRLAAKHGPMFRAEAWNELWVCIIGLPLCSRFLQQCGDAARPVTLDLERLFPKGFLRQMRAGDHKKYRTDLTKAIREDNPSRYATDFEAAASHFLAAYSKRQQRETGWAPEAYVATLTEISSAMLIRMFFGASLGSIRYEELMVGYRKLGPHGLVWNPGPRQETAFGELCENIRRGLTDHADSDGIAGRLHKNGLLDDTMLGNLIYMVEMGRYDTHGLFRWLSKYASENPELLQRIADEDGAASTGNSFARAFVLETLRMDQSERLIRRVKRDIVFEGYLIPRFSNVRLCLWESHKSEESFPQPFRFDPERFLQLEPSGDRFSPFGLDHHYCPMSVVAVDMSEIFIRVLAREYTITAVGDGDAIRGAYHWEPAAAFSVRLAPKKGIAHAV